MQIQRGCQMRVSLVAASLLLTLLHVRTGRTQDEGAMPRALDRGWTRTRKTEVELLRPICETAPIGRLPGGRLGCLHCPDEAPGIGELELDVVHHGDLTGNGFDEVLAFVRGATCYGHTTGWGATMLLRATQKDGWIKLWEERGAPNGPCTVVTVPLAGVRLLCDYGSTHQGVTAGGLALCAVNESALACDTLVPWSSGYVPMACAEDSVTRWASTNGRPLVTRAKGTVYLDIQVSWGSARLVPDEKHGCREGALIERRRGTIRYQWDGDTFAPLDASMSTLDEVRAHAE